MTTLDFRRQLIAHPFSHNNSYVIDRLMGSGLYFHRSKGEYPYIMNAPGHASMELMYSEFNSQLRGRLLNTARIKEVLDSAEVPINISIKGISYLMGKGFLAHWSGTRDSINVLYIACCSNKPSLTMEDIKFYVSKDVYKEIYKPLHPVFKDLVGTHPGDIIMCRDIRDYVGEKIKIPKGLSISALNNYKSVVVKQAINQYIGERDVKIIVESQDPLPF